VCETIRRRTLGAKQGLLLLTLLLLLLLVSMLPLLAQGPPKPCKDHRLTIEAKQERKEKKNGKSITISALCQTLCKLRRSFRFCRRCGSISHRCRKCGPLRARAWRAACRCQEGT
jgi:hypothetical protein